MPKSEREREGGGGRGDDDNDEDVGMQTVEVRSNGQVSNCVI